MSARPSFSFSFLLALTLTIASTLSPLNLRAQQTTVDIPLLTIRANTRLVVVDVVVTDKSGAPVTGLKPEDFALQENGKAQKISIFVPPGMGNKLPPGQEMPGILSNHPENVAAPGLPMVLLLDAANSPFKDQAYGRLQMLKYVGEQSESRHPMAVVTLTDQLRMLQSFTSDPRVLASAIRNFKPQEPILLSTDANSPTQAQLTTDSSAGLQAQLTDFAKLQISYDLERRTLITVDAMRALARMLGGLPGRKNVIWLTAQMPFDLIPEDRTMSPEELRADLPAQGRQRPVDVNAAGALAAEQRMLHAQAIREAEAQLASAGIAIYPVDMRGLMVSGIDVATTGTMEEIAAETGGKAYSNQNEIKNGIALAASDEKASYSLGYYPENKKWDGKYRSIKIKLAPSGAQIRYRKGYFAVDPVTKKNANFDQDVSAALQFNAPSTQISFMAQAKTTDPGKVRIMFLVDAHTLTTEDAGGNKKMNVAFYAGMFDSKGKSMGIRSTKIDRAFDAATYQQIVDKGMMVPLEVDVPAGAKELHLAVVDNRTGFIGTVNGPLGQ
jgi:VWFA-related protein